MLKRILCYLLAFTLGMAYAWFIYTYNNLGCEGDGYELWLDTVTNKQ